MQKPHAARIMKPALSLIAALSVSATGLVHAQEVTARKITLEECIQMALAKNLDLRLARYAPEFTKLNIWGDHSAWDANWTTSAGQSFQVSEAVQAVGTVAPPPNENWTEQFNTSINGMVPWGMTYRVDAGTDRSSGLRFVDDGAGHVIIPKDAGFFYRPAVTLSLTQPLLKDFWIDSARWQLALDRKALQQDAEDIRGQVINAVTIVQIAYYDLIYKRESVVVQQKALETAERFLAEQKKRVEIGSEAPLVEKQAESQVARVRSDLLQAEQDLAAAQNQLKAIIGDDFAAFESTRFEPSEPLNVIPTVFNKTDSWNRALSTRPDIVRSRLELERQKITLRFRRNQLYPELDLLGSYGLRGYDTTLTPALDDIGDLRNPNHSIGIRLSIPLSNRGARASLKSAKLANEQLLLQHKRLEQGIIRTIDDAIYSARTALDRIESTKAARIYAEAALDAEQKKLENGKSTSFFVLQLQRDLTSAQSEEIRAQSDYNKAISRLNQAEASTLDKAGVKIEIR